MEMIGYITALLIGLSLGLIGGGGSILTVPILVYLFGVAPILATSYSLFIVGVTSMIGAIGQFTNRQVHPKIVLVFGPLSLITVFLIRHYIIPHLPQSFQLFGGSVSVSFITMLLFALLMIASSVSMIKDNNNPTATSAPDAGWIRIALSGIGVGLVTGFLGAGGGFLLIPALVLLLHLPIKTAIGTSLVIITINSLIGFADDITHHEMNWNLLLIITGISITGVLIGTALGEKINGNSLKKGFGWFVLIMGIYIIIHELITANNF